MTKPALQENYAMNEFTLDEAIKLIYRHVVLKKNANTLAKKTDITLIGHVCGVLTLNEQIEVVVKFHDELKQFTKEEFDKEAKLLDC
ncbi:hypothetical protein JCM14076_30150 [Methylosoma difficile]